MSFNPRTLLQLLIPLAVLILLLVLRPTIPRLGHNAQVLLLNLPYLLAVACAVLAVQINHARFFLLALLTGGAYWLVQTKLQVSLVDPQAAATYLGLGVGLGAVVLLLFCLPDRELRSGYGLLAYTLAVVLVGAGASLVVDFLPQIFQQHSGWIGLWPRPDFVLPPAISALHVLVLLTGLLVLCLRNRAADAALLVTLLSGSILLAVFYLPNLSQTMFTVAGISQVYALLRSSHAMVYRDELTGLLSRRAYNEQLRRLGKRYAIAMLDIDHFKKLNDTYGHDVGDQVLRLIASIIDRVGGGGTAYRYGGEEFCIVFPGVSGEACLSELERLRNAIADYDIVLRDKGERPATAGAGSKRRGGKKRGSSVAVTVSIGLADNGGDNADAEDVYKEADKQLYKAKQGGRNRLSYDC
jgi:diguanylate cyclase (GGDEF)-like protein